MCLGVFDEFDRPPSPRAKEHLGSALYAQPDATAVLVELESSMLSPKLLDDIEDLVKRRAGDTLEANRNNQVFQQ